MKLFKPGITALAIVFLLLSLTVLTTAQVSTLNTSLNIRSNSIDYDDSGQTIGSTDYVTKRLISETNPNTSSAWLYTEINSAEFGIKVD